jgi:hypothetical protein
LAAGGDVLPIQYGDMPMSQLPCKRFWEGPVGITLMPRKQHSGEYFWTFAFTRAFKRKGKETWEYTDFFGHKHATALGTVMSRAMQFMEQNPPDEFTAKCMAEDSAQQEGIPIDKAAASLAGASFPPLKSAA